MLALKQRGHILDWGAVPHSSTINTLGDIAMALIWTGIQYTSLAALIGMCITKWVIDFRAWRAGRTKKKCCG